ncbi:MAG: hypothetical protein AAB557_03555 [Patescibacteria group bacterium]
MLTKNDLQQIKSVVDDSLQPLKQDVSTLKTDITTLKTDVSGLKQDVATVKTDISLVKIDLRGVKDKLDELFDFSIHAIGDILDWTNEIHTTIVKKKLPERVERLEKHVGIPPLAN